MRILKMLIDNNREIDCFDDSWNDTTSSIFNFFSFIKKNNPSKKGRKIAILGRIVHLAEQSKSFHESLASPLLQTGIELLITHGEEMKYLHDVMPETLQGPHFVNATSLVQHLRDNLRDGDMIMVKGSRRNSGFGSIIRLLQEQCKPIKMISTGSSEHKKIILKIMSKGENNFSTSPHLKNQGSLSIALLKDAVKRRGMEAINHRKLIFEVTDGSISTIFSHNTPDKSIIATVVAPDKSMTKKVLAYCDVSVPDGSVFDSHSYEEALKYFSGLSYPVVIKPLRLYGGKGVTTNIEDEDSFNQAWLYAAGISKKVIVEKFIPGDDMRVLVLGNKAVAAYVRIPAHVVGNGKDSIRNLIEEKNRKRKKNPRLRISLIKRVDLLERTGRSMDDIPYLGEHVQLTSVANISMGGDIVEVTEYVHPSVLAVAEKAVQSIPGLLLAGVDLIITDFTRDIPGGVTVIEVNSDPAIPDVVFPTYGKGHALPDLVLDVAFANRSALTATEYEEPSIKPALVYVPSCGNKSFPRNYATQLLLIRQAAHARNLRVHRPAANLTYISDEEKTIAFSQGMTHLTRSIARRATNDKDWTKRLLSKSCINTPAWESFAINHKEKAWEFVKNFNKPVVLKPIYGSGGKGITTNINEKRHFDNAWLFALNSGARIIIVEEYFTGKDYRIFVIDKSIVAASHRIPAYIVGDGVSTISELISIKNKKRLKNPHDGAKPIEITQSILQNLNIMAMNGESVPVVGMFVKLHDVANIGTGGESQDVTEIVHPGFAEIMVDVKNAVFQPLHAGVDMIAQDISKSPDNQRWTVVEVNANPDFGIHHFPSHGKARDVTGALIEWLFPKSLAQSTQCKSIRVLINGKVQGVGYRKWTWKQAHLHAVRGWVRNLRNGQVEAIFSGMPNAVEHLLEVCHNGPSRAKVTKIDITPFHGDIKSFKIVT